MNSKNKQSQQFGKVLFYEPNDNDNSTIVNQEDLSIYVDLETKTKSTTTITISESGDSDISRNSTKNKTIKFFEGSAYGEGNKRFLTTNYTEAVDIANGESGSETESLGIESINIDFDTAYTPLIKIKFVDVRGNSIMTRGTDSKYSMFFELPYPIFTLTVKGYYGRPVKYCLHLTKWNSKFNSETGNFEIDAEFIGFTYAILTDLLIGLCRAVVFTDEGAKVFEELSTEFKNVKTSNGSTITPMTIDDFIKKTSQIKSEFEKLKDDDSDINELNNISKVRDRLNKLEKRINISIESLKTLSKGTVSPSLFTSEGIVFLNYSQADSKSIDNNIKNLIKENEEDINEVKPNNKSNKAKAGDAKSLTPINSLTSLVTNRLNEKQFNFINRLDYAKINLFKNQDVNELKKSLKGKSKNDEEKEKLINLYIEKVTNKLLTNTNNNQNNDLRIIVLDFKHMFDEIKRLKVVLNKSETELSEKTSNKLIQVAEEELSFVPTIRNVFRILTFHCEVLVETLRRVGISAEKNKTRSKILKNLGNNPFKLKNKENIYSFPEYRKAVDNGQGSTIEESWLGSDLTPEQIIDVDEVLFIEDLLNKLLKIASTSEDVVDGFNLDVLNEYHPIGPFDTTLGFHNKENSYKEALIGDKGNRKIQDALRVLLIRNFTLQGLSQYKMRDELVTLYGKLEAENLFDVIKNNIEPEQQGVLINNFNNFGVDGDKFTERLISAYSRSGEFSRSDSTLIKEGGTIYKVPSVFADKFIKTNGYVYDYLKSDFNKSKTKSVSDKTSRVLLPLNSVFKRDLLVDSNDDKLINLSKVNFSNYVDSVNTILGGEYEFDAQDNLTTNSIFRIMSTSEYDDANSGTITNTKADFGRDSINEYNKNVTKGVNYIKQTNIIDTEFNLGLNPLEGFLGCAEFFIMDYDSKEGDSNDNDLFNSALGDKKASTFYAFWKSRTGSYSNSVITNKHERFKIYEQNVNGKGKIILTEKNALYTTVKPHDGLDFRTVLGTHKDDLKVKEDETNKKNSDGKKLTDKEKKLLADSESKNKLRITDFKYYNKEGAVASLFSSDIYTWQSDDESKAYLFLSSLPWQGVSSKNFKTDGLFPLKSNLDSFIEDSGIFSSDKLPGYTNTVSGLFTKHPAFINAPKMWCAFIGAVLSRMDFEFKVNLKPLNLRIFDNEPNLDEYMTVENRYGFQLSFGDKYKKVDEVIRRLPKSIKDEFKNAFNNFVNSEFQEIKENLEVFKSFDYEKIKELNKRLTSKMRPFRTIYKEINTDDYNSIINDDEFKGLFNDNFTKNYSFLLPSNLPFKKGKFTFSVSIGNNEEFNDRLLDILSEEVVILNSVPRFFSDLESFTSGPNGDERALINGSLNIYVEEKPFKLFLSTFYNQFKKLSKNYTTTTTEKEELLKKRLFNSINSDDIKLNLYRTVSSIFKKWVTDTEGIFSQCGTCKYDRDIAKKRRGSDTPRLIDSFRFIDRSLTDIGDKFYINPLKVTEMLNGNYNQSFFDVANRILTDNNFNFIALPTFVNYNDKDDLIDMFTPQPYNDSINNSNSNVGPAFICTYIGQGSTNLNIDSSNDEDDGIFLNDGDLNDLPPDFTTNDKPIGSLSIPIINIAYGKQNQSIFKDVSIDQREFSETAESLEIIEDISKGGDKKDPKYISQNLFNVYQKRSYSSEIEMMGNPMIQPMSYFHLSDIPMFRGIYIITKVSHNITANHMTTKIKGTRVKFARTKMIDASTLFMNLIESFNEGDTGSATNGENIKRISISSNELKDDSGNNAIKGIQIK